MTTPARRPPLLPLLLNGSIRLPGPTPKPPTPIWIGVDFALPTTKEPTTP